MGLPAQAALDCNSIFPGPIQSHDSAGTLYMQSGARVEGYNGLEVCFKQVTGYDYEMSSQACGAGKCQITGVASLKQARPTFPGTTDSASYTVANWTTPTVILGITPNYGKAASSSRWDLGSLTIDGSVGASGSGNVSFSDSYSTYVIKSVTMQNGGIMTLTAGKTYIIEGDLTLTGGSLIKLVGSGTTSFYVKGNITAHNDSQLQTGSAFKAYVVGSITLTGSDQLAGTYYAEGDATLENQVVLRGQLSAKNVNLKGSSKVIYDDGEPLLTCFSDDFSSSTLSNSWVVAQRNNSTLPSVQNGRLRLTQNTTNQATSATFQRLFPGANNLVTIEFDQYAYKTSGSSGADGMAVVLSDATITPQPGAFGGPLGYGFKTGISGFAGGWMGVGLDEYGNYSNEGGSYNPGSRPQAVSIRGSSASSGTSGYRYLAGTASNLNPAVDSGTNSNRPHRYRITVDSRTAGSSLASVERNTGSGYSTLVGPINMVNQTGQAAVPANFLLSLTGSTGSVTNFHELDNVQICALNSSPVGTQIDHFEFVHSGNALTCNPETLTIRACANASCSQLITDQVSATLTPLKNGSNGWVASDQVTYNGNAATVTFSGGSTTLQLRNNLASAMTVGVSGSIPSTKPLSTTLCQAGSGALSTAACTLSFADSGFVFDVLDTLANKPQQVVMKAVRKDNATQLCVPSFASVSKPVSFWSDYVSPASNTFGSKVTVNGNAIATSQGAATASNLSFDAKGETTLTVNYPDAGQMRLNARHDGSGDTAGLVMTGSDLFVSRPVGLCITPTQGVCTAGSSSCPLFKRTGEDFPLTIAAMAWQADNDGDLCSGNLPTPNFALANIALGSRLVAPKPGVEAVVGKTSYNHVISTSNNLNTVTQSLNEVGVFRMTATPPVATSPEGSTVSTGYFGYTIPAASSAPVGRFVPWDFNLVSGSVTPAFGGFSYMSQPFGVRTTVQARNKQGGVTQNYRDAFAKGVISLVAGNNQDGVDRSNRLDPLSQNWVSGQTTFDGQSRFVRLRELTPTLTAPEEPLRLLRLGLKVGDGEATETSFLSDRNMNPAVSGSCQSGVNCTARQLSIPKGAGDTMIAYYGRLLASTRQGVDSAPLALPLQVQYFEGGLWRVNQQDVCSQQNACSQISLAGGGIVFTDADQRYDAATGDLVLKDGTRIRLGLGNLAPGGTQVGFNGGETRFHFAPPNQAVRIPYQIVLEKQPLQPLAPTWLADPATADHLTGMAIFGRDRGNDRIIYRREVMP
ncbi:MSHA biogenesis protein MshQ [Aeromonas lusitana]|uniref:MSHA biogenesis protein MshQ n=2 Tax=Aeromonas lusitana TaxID=931529 RepID=A0A2M8HDL9_9GAMM|nr:MSHA biogenesis protein MshQ [Aeromonas lusitana]